MQTTNEAMEKAKLARADRLTRNLTAFRSFGEMAECMDRGYVPTIRPTSKARRELIEIVRASGHLVWTGINE